MKTAAYCRFSSSNQRETSIRDQLRNIEQYCARLGWPSPVLYQDQAISGSRHDRPGYQAMLAAADARQFNVLLVDDLSRLSRDHIESAQTIRRLKFLGVRIIGVSDGTDTERDTYKLETGLRGLMAEYYLDDLRQKTHRGLTGQALAGYSAGGLPYGYESIHDGKGFKRRIVEEQAHWVRYIFRRFDEGATVRAIADELNRKGVPTRRGHTWAHTALYPDAKMVGILSNPIYNGQQIWNRTQWLKDPMTGKRKRIIRPREDWIITQAPELKIVDDDLWESVQARIRAKREATAQQRKAGKRFTGSPNKYLFSGLLKCGICGGAYTLQGSNYYGCSTRKNRGTSVCPNTLTVRKSIVESVLLADVRKTLLSEEAFREFETQVNAMLNSAAPDTAPIKRRIQQAKQERDNLLNAIKSGIITPSTKDALTQAEVRLQEAENELEIAEHPVVTLPRAREVYNDLVSRLEEVIDNTERAREALRHILGGDIRLIPEKDGTLTAEMNSAGLSGAIYKRLVAGEGFEPPTFGL